MTEQPETPQQIPPALAQNGHTPSQIMIALLEQMPQMLFNAMTAALERATVCTAGYKCADCVAARWAWAAAHKTQTEAAYAAYMQAMTELAALPGDGPRRAAAPDFTVFLPPALQPGGAEQMPGIADGEVMVNGTVKCANHAPGAPGTQGGSRLLVAQAGFTPSMIAGLR
jgi:hypothetical protein